MTNYGKLLCSMALLFGILVAGCGSTSTSNPLGLSACQQNNTADVVFQNNSATSKSYDIVWDGSRIESNLTPGAASATHTQSAGSHTLEFHVAGTQTNACSPASPSLAQCSSHTFSCSN
jgi:hypothetical protein